MQPASGSNYNRGKGRYWGKECEIHPQMGGLRLIAGGKCVGCRNDHNKKNKNRKRMLARARAKYKEAILIRTPPWADLKIIKETYLTAKTLGMTVDHIIPLRGAIVSGLHIAENLQILSLEDGKMKGNSFNIEKDKE